MGKQMKGLLGEKLGMTQVFDENNRIVPVTVVAAGSVRGHPGAVRRTSTATPPSRSATAPIDPRKVNKPETGHFAKAGVTPRRVTRRAAHRRRHASTRSARRSPPSCSRPASAST